MPMHQLRLTHATELVNDKVSLATSRERLGHKNIQTKLRYAEQSDDIAERGCVLDGGEKKAHPEFIPLLHCSVSGSKTCNALKETMPKQNQFKVPKKMLSKYEEIIAITDQVCERYINAEYANLSRKMATALSRKRPSPLERARTKSWAAGVLYPLAQVNFLFDKNQIPNMSARQLCQALEISQGTASAKARDIWNILDLFPLQPDYCQPSLLDANLMVWMQSVNGLIVDIRDMSRAVQVQAY